MVKWDGWRALFMTDVGHLVLHSRRGTGLLPSFSEVRTGAAQVPNTTALDGVM
ncbi:hypothetical protein ACFV2H_44510 [Streptomyces sp. NPDC059629]|uniref:hypothetical protein n=1 Tax=Streptomyces sp. NPDC059629 TaxID=3346889 RepID=UPI0036BA85DF